MASQLAAASSSVPANRIHLINDEWTKVYDRTTEGAITICGCAPQEILWKGLHILLDDPEDCLRRMIYSRKDFTDHVIVSDGKKPGFIFIFEKELRRKAGGGQRERTVEIDTRMIKQDIDTNVFEAPLPIAKRIAMPYFIAKTLTGPKAADPVIPVDDLALLEQDNALPAQPNEAAVTSLPEDILIALLSITISNPFSRWLMSSGSSKEKKD
jgi:hypothetical protein